MLEARQDEFNCFSKHQFHNTHHPGFKWSLYSSPFLPGNVFILKLSLVPIISENMDLQNSVHCKRIFEWVLERLVVINNLNDGHFIEWQILGCFRMDWRLRSDSINLEDCKGRVKAEFKFKLWDECVVWLRTISLSNYTQDSRTLYA